MKGVVACPACSREQEVAVRRAQDGKLVPLRGLTCEHCGSGNVSAARVTRECAPDPRASVERELDAMLGATVWSTIPLAKKLAIAAEVAR